MTPTKRWATIAGAAAVTTAAVYLLAVWWLARRASWRRLEAERS